MSTGMPEKPEMPLRGLMCSCESWLATLMSGLALIVLGALAIMMPLAAATTIELIIGWVFVFGGIIQAFNSIMRAQEHRLLTLLTGLLFFLAGVLLLAHPWQGVLMLALILSVAFIIEGVLKIAGAIAMGRQTHRGWLLASGVVALALGLLIWAMWPLDAAWVVGLIVGVDFVLGGLAMVMLSLAMRDAFEASGGAGAGPSGGMGSPT